MSADSAHVQGISGGESTNSPVVSGSHSLTFDTKYVFCFSNIIIVLDIMQWMTITLLLVLWEFLQTKFILFAMFNLSVNL